MRFGLLGPLPELRSRAQDRVESLRAAGVDEARLSMVVSTVHITHPGPGAFQAGTFDQLIGRHVHIAGLHPSDPGAAVHTLTAAEVTTGPRQVFDEKAQTWSTRDVMGAAATLTVRTELPAALDMGRDVSVDNRTPKARVHIVDSAGADVTRRDRPARLDAALHTGQVIWVGDTRYQVTGTAHPGRDPETGFTPGDVDVQVATVRLVDPQPPVQPA